jgi:hypothetical protein
MLVRGSNGNMLFLCSAVFAATVVIFGLFFWAFLIFFCHDVLQMSCEKTAFVAAQELNFNDHSGKLNNLLICSRELVYTDRQMLLCTQTCQDFAELQPFAADILDDARENSKCVCQERTTFTTQTLNKLRQIIADRSNRSNWSAMVLNISQSEPQIVDFRLGNLANNQSNVIAHEAVLELFYYDIRKRFIVSGKQNDLYRAGVNLELPPPDNDLQFALSPVIAPTLGNISPLRLAANDHFVNTIALRESGQDLPSLSKLSPNAIQLTMAVQLKERVVGSLHASTACKNTACGYGGTPWPEK